MSNDERMGETPTRIDAEKVVAVSNQQIGGDANFYLAEGGSQRIPVHKPPRNLPERQKTFAGREAELLELHQELSANADVGITQQTAVHGHGGVGKTSVATEYGWRHLADYPGGVFFLSCEASPGAPRLEELAPHLGLPALGTPEETAQRVRAQLETGEASLLILDNVSGPEECRTDDWRRVLPVGACRRLMTTRAEKLPDVQMYRLQRLSREDGVKLLARYRADVAQEEALAARIVEWFDGLAVGLTVVGVYMQMHLSLSWQRYVDSLEKKGLGAVRGTEAAVGRLLRYRQRVDAVFDDVLDSLPAEERRALEYAALLPEDNVYAPWLVELLDEEGVEAPELPGYEGRSGERAVEALVDRQLLRPRGEGDVVLGLHRVLRGRAGERLLAQDLRDGAIDRLVALAERRGSGSHAALTVVALRGELTPLASLAREFAVLGRVDAGVSLANWIAAPLREMGRYREARDLLADLEGAGALEVVSDGETAIFHSNLAGILKELGELKEARGRMERAVQIGERNFPEDHPSLATRYSNLALILKDLGELKEARERMERAVRIGERNFPEDHPSLATSYSNLALILKDLGELKEARERMERAVQIGERNFPEDHPSLATSYSNLALILKDLGELKEARERMERAVQIDERNFPEDHPSLATIYSNLALILQELGELKEARERMERAVQIDERNFPEDHPSLATNYNNLAHIEWELGRTDVACTLFQRSRAILLKHFKPDHRYIASVSASIQKVCGNGGTSPDVSP